MIDTLPRPDCGCATNHAESFDTSVGRVVCSMLDNFYAQMASEHLCERSSPYILERVFFNLVQSVAMSMHGQRSGIFEISDLATSIIASKPILEDIIKDLPERLMVHYEKSLAAAEVAKQGLSS